MTGDQQTRVYISYHTADRPFRDELARHLRGLGELFRDRDSIPYGDNVAIATRWLEEAQVVVVLVSADYLAEPECMAELDLAVATRLPDGSRRRVLLVLIRACAWAVTRMKEHRVFNTEPISSLTPGDRDGFWTRLGLEIYGILTNTHRTTDPGLSTSAGPPAIIVPPLAPEPPAAPAAPPVPEASPAPVICSTPSTPPAPEVSPASSTPIDGPSAKPATSTSAAPPQGDGLGSPTDAGVSASAKRSRMPVTRQRLVVAGIALAAVAAVTAAFWLSRDPEPPPKPVEAKPCPDSTVLVDEGDFCIDANEVTVSEYTAWLKGRPPAPPEDLTPGQEGQCNYGKADRQAHPVNCVSWTMAARYCGARGGRLPSSEEWTLAARQQAHNEPGARPAENAFPWKGAPEDVRGNELYRYACAGREQDGQSRGGTCPVGSYAGPVQDLAGNVWEWMDKPKESATCDVRGGSWRSRDHQELMVSHIAGVQRKSITSKQDDIGFRCRTELRSPHLGH